MMKPNEPNTLNNIFENLNASKKMKESFLLKYGEDISEAIKEEGVRVVSGSSNHKLKTPHGNISGVDNRIYKCLWHMHRSSNIPKAWNLNVRNK